MKTKFTLAAALVLCSAATTFGQSIGPSAMNASGGSKVIAGNTYEYSIGEMPLVHTATGANIIVTNGVLQPSPASVTPPPSGVKNVHNLANHLTVYPNPSDNMLYLQPDFETGGQLTYHLYDALGRVMLSGVFKLVSGNEKQSLSLDQFAAGSYVLLLELNKKGITDNASFNVQKIN